MARDRNGQAINREFKRRIYREETISGGFFGPGKKTTDGWGPLSVREGEGPGYRFGKKNDGPRAASGAGPERRPRPLYLFFFSFSVFLFLLYLLQKCFKSIQTTFINFVKFTARF
jgi:hypothetical protein